MSTKYTIELIEEHPSVNFYSLHIEGNLLSEVEIFFEKFPLGCEYDEDIDIIISWMDKIGEKGAMERYFRPEGNYGDGVSAIPIETSNLRLYCLRISNSILIFGNGGVKDSASWEESTTLSDYVEILKDTGIFLRSRIKDKIVIIEDKDIKGNLNFTRYEKK